METLVSKICKYNEWLIQLSEDFVDSMYVCILIVKNRIVRLIDYNAGFFTKNFYLDLDLIHIV